MLPFSIANTKRCASAGVSATVTAREPGSAWAACSVSLLPNEEPDTGVYVAKIRASGTSTTVCVDVVSAFLPVEACGMSRNVV
jgi:hypothetical protein